MSEGEVKAGDSRDLILKLCNHLAKNDAAVSSHLSQVALNFLSISSSLSVPNASDEQYVIGQSKQLLSEISKDNVQQFELLYSNLCKSNVLKNRCSILTFLFHVANSPKTEFTCGAVENLEKFPNIGTPFLLKPQNSLESVRSIYKGTNALKSIQSSSTNTQSSRTTTASSQIWSKHESEFLTVKQSDLTLVTESDLLQDVIYSLQGIAGQYLRKEAGGLGFIMDPKVQKIVSPIHRGLVDRLISTSFLHNQIKQYCDDSDKQSGVISLALVATLRDELSDYYKGIALLKAANGSHSLDQPMMSLRKALVYLNDHHVRFEWLAYISEQCVDKKGGALISAVHGFMHHGSKCAQQVSDKVLRAVCKPFYIMLSRWLLDGEINDPSNEFFIQARDIAVAERLWYDKYRVRKYMVPSFITMDQANRILATGKNINFLKQICKDSGHLPGRGALQKFSTTNSVEALFAPEQSIEFDSILEKIYKDTSLRVLDLLKNKYRLLEHLQSLRRYLLLGQGDFIRHLLELLVPELNKPAQHIYGHTLSAILESAIRVTNAQFEDEDTLKRLNVSFMGHSHGDTGWDVFSLVYIVDGPVGTIFQPTMTTYQCLFGALWKAKRMEFVLASMRKQQIAMAKLLRDIKELKPVTHLIHVLTSEMIHFLHQTQYYFLFEVLECSWAEMLRRVNQAECLDDIINAHNSFLSSVKSGVLLDETSRALFSKLRMIYNFILDLEALQESLNVASTSEYESYVAFREKVDKIGINAQDEMKAKERILQFHSFLNSNKTKVKHLAQSYKQFVREYLNLLSTSSDMNLQLLSVRLSFNDYYKVI